MAKFKHYCIWGGIVSIMIILGVVGCSLFDREERGIPTNPARLPGVANYYASEGVSDQSYGARAGEGYFRVNIPTAGTYQIAYWVNHTEGVVTTVIGPFYAFVKQNQAALHTLGLNAGDTIQRVCVTPGTTNNATWTEDATTDGVWRLLNSGEVAWLDSSAGRVFTPNGDATCVIEDGILVAGVFETLPQEFPQPAPVVVAGATCIADGAACAPGDTCCNASSACGGTPSVCTACIADGAACAPGDTCCSAGSVCGGTPSVCMACIPDGDPCPVGGLGCCTVGWVCDGTTSTCMDPCDPSRNLTFAGATHSVAACTAAGGLCYDTGATGTICRFTNLSAKPITCPILGGWVQAANWGRMRTNAEVAAAYDELVGLGIEVVCVGAGPDLNYPINFMNAVPREWSANNSSNEARDGCGNQTCPSGEVEMEFITGPFGDAEACVATQDGSLFFDRVEIGCI